MIHFRPKPVYLFFGHLTADGFNGCSLSRGYARPSLTPGYQYVAPMELSFFQPVQAEK
jgi:hypothetical protein